MFYEALFGGGHHGRVMRPIHGPRETSDSPTTFESAQLITLVAVFWIFYLARNIVREAIFYGKNEWNLSRDNGKIYYSQLQIKEWFPNWRIGVVKFIGEGVQLFLLVVFSTYIWSSYLFW